MSFTQKILIPLSDQEDTSLVVRVNVFESEGQEIGLLFAKRTTIYDDFDDNSLDPAKWNETDSGSNITEINQQLEHEGNGSFNANGLVSDTSWPLIAGAEWSFTFSPYATSDAMYGPSSSSTLTIVGDTACLYADGGNNFKFFRSGTAYDSGYDYIAGKTYNARMVYQDPGWNIYIQSDDDASYSSEVEIFSTELDTSSPVYFHLNSHTAMSGKSILDDVAYTIENYPTSSPSPVAVWTALPSGAEVDMSTAKCWMFKDGVVQAAGNTDIKFKYAANNGSLSAAKTLTELRAESDLTISNSTNSFKAVGVYASDGTYESKSSAWLEVDVIYPEGNGGGVSRGRIVNDGV